VWINKWLKNPNALTPGTMMPNPNLPDGEARDLTAFLATLKVHRKGGTK
jgi:cytochrome c1